MTVFESFLTLYRVDTEAASKRSERAARSFGFAFDGRAGDAYSEEVFRHFLEVERMRAERSERRFLLLLVGIHRCPKEGIHIPAGQVAPLFSGLRNCVREVDFVGWYREGRVLGAVLAQGFDAPGAAAHSDIVGRVKRVLRGHLPGHVADRLRVRVVELGSTTTF